jgi:3-oxoacyl-[acyl-carrier protein] reductase
MPSAIVTGAATGIGKGIARTLAAAGAAVIVNYLDHPELANAVVADIAARGGNAAAVQADISRRLEVQRLFDETIRLFGRVDILVNNAAVALLKPLTDVSEADFDRVFSVNVKGTMFCCQRDRWPLHPAVDPHRNS